MSAAFTSGPWGVEHFGDSVYVGQLRQGGGRSGFEAVLYATDCRDYTEAALGRELANASLIAAGPDGYAVGEKALAWMLPHGGDPEAAEIIDELSAFLAKARGQ